jgi:quercetin dioxygenase-like cupin family protein
LAGARSEAKQEAIKLVSSAKLPNVPGKSVTAIVVSYAPGGKSGKHHHAGSVLSSVLSGEIRSENSATGPAKVYKAGESFFEPPGSEHLVSENASTTELRTAHEMMEGMRTRRRGKIVLKSSG